MWVAFVGSREYARCACIPPEWDPEPKAHQRGCRYPAHFALIARALGRWMERDDFDGVVSGGAIGTDSAAALACEMNDVECIVYPVTDEEWKAHPKTAGHMRNTKIVQKADAIVAFFAPGPLTSGTKDTVRKGIIAGRPVYTYHEGVWEAWERGYTARHTQSQRYHDVWRGAGGGSEAEREEYEHARREDGDRG